MKMNDTLHNDKFLQVNSSLNDIDNPFITIFIAYDVVDVSVDNDI